MYDQDFWNERYASDEFLYGTEPNAFLVEQAHVLQSPVLALSEGEGRNAVFMASRGLEVLGVDCSAVGLEKAHSLAEAHGVTIETEVADLAEYQPQENRFGAVVSIFAHLPSSVRARLYPLVEKSLRKGGILVLEAYSERQLDRSTGGPRDIDMLMTIAKLEREFPNLTPLLAREIEREVVEGKGHTGQAVVVQYVARREG